MKNLFLIIGLTIFLIGLVFVIIKTQNQSNASNSPSLFFTDSANMTSISIYNKSFNPAIFEINRGSTVVWINNDSNTYTITSNDDYFNSGNLQPGEKFSFTFNNNGDYPYYSSTNPTMKGIITVK